jgi:protein transport protein SEC31
MQRVKSKAPSTFKAQVNDTEKRLNILFDHLNNEDLLKEDTIQSMVELSQAVQARDFEQAQAIHVEIMTNKTDECGNWMVSNLLPHIVTV